MRGGGQRPFGIFPKIHLIWKRDPSLKTKTYRQILMQRQTFAQKNRRSRRRLLPMQMRDLAWPRQDVTHRRKTSASNGIRTNKRPLETLIFPSLGVKSLVDKATYCLYIKAKYQMMKLCDFKMHGYGSMQ